MDKFHISIFINSCLNQSFYSNLNASNEKLDYVFDKLDIFLIFRLPGPHFSLIIVRSSLTAL